ncbi:J domain-containing protein required for chloroplast accumulation response 1-like isoform X1 [Camellia sinensis]|uniref:J domain-containing protein required for chloroplast accumulation response 1-like isoform X1 n=2 Tax=Camellia sinensis TaxID=4442 RepID=UPI001035547B|nr:J domain-containing protein required for chloroplast accumulation response 1-like isoform X1 [Camellia sinensis]
MERFAQRENVLLSYCPQKPLKDSDIDFHDVFGGPPRRFSMQEMRYSFTKSMNSTGNTTRGEDDRVLPQNPWSGLNEMPVFGEETVNHRRYTSDDFFDDIFRVDESLSSPRRSNQYPSCSTPGSLVSTPSHSLRSRADPFGNSLPAQFQLSLPAKLTKTTEFPAFASSNRSSYRGKDPASNGINCVYTPSSPLSRQLSEAFQEEDELRSEIHQSYRPSPLSHEFSLSNKEPPCITKSGELESMDRGNLKKDLKNTEAPSNSSRFHFSIYKWASKAVPMHLRLGNSPKSKARVKTKRCSSSNGRIERDTITSNGLEAANGHDSDLHFLNYSVSANNESPYTEGRKQDRDSLLETSTEDRVEPCHIVEDTVLSMPRSISVNKIPNTVKTVAGDAILSDKREEIKSHSVSETGVEITEKGIATSMQGAQKPELNHLRSPLYDTDVGQAGNDELIRKSEGKDSMVKNMTVSESNADVSKNLKECDDKRINSNREEVVQENELHSQDSSRTSGDNLGRNGAEGKVKEFVKIFNQEATSQPKSDIKTRSQSSRWRSTSSFGADNEGSANITQKNGKNHFHSVNKTKTPPNASFKVDKNFEELEQQQPHSKTRVISVSEISVGQKDASASSSESRPDGSKVAVGNIDDLFQEDFVIKELSHDQYKLLQTEEGYDDIQISDAKIQQWSNGKEGNIRSLLSTLQYVLWPGSGWKPVPLVDIIEGSAVKRVYQKTLLCLHPDKLQQKGAASQQKYIAEKVFDILQDSWDNFNSLGAI